jgi:hypothetical protein
MHLAHYLGLLHRSLQQLGSAFHEVGDAHAEEPDIAHLCQKLGGQCEQDAGRLAPFVATYGEDAPDEPERLHSELFSGTRDGGLGLLRDLHDLYLMATECDISWTMVAQAAQGARDPNLLDVATAGQAHTTIQLAWIRTRMKQAAPQALVVAS